MKNLNDLWLLVLLVLLSGLLSFQVSSQSLQRPCIPLNFTFPPLPGVPIANDSTSTPIEYFITPAASQPTGKLLCLFFNGTLANVTGSEQYYRIAASNNCLQGPTWYTSWNTDDYLGSCLVLTPGGGTFRDNCTTRAYEALCERPVGAWNETLLLGAGSV